MTATAYVEYQLHCDATTSGDLSCLEVYGPFGVERPRAKLRKLAERDGWVTGASKAGPDLCPAHKHLADLSQPGAAVGARARSMAAPASTAGLGQPDARQAKSGGRESGTEDQAAEREGRALHGLNHAHTDLPRPPDAPPSLARGVAGPGKPDLSQPEDMSSREMPRHSRGMSATAGLGQVTSPFRPFTFSERDLEMMRGRVRNGGWTGAAPTEYDLSWCRRQADTGSMPVQPQGDRVRRAANNVLARGLLVVPAHRAGASAQRVSRLARGAARTPAGRCHSRTLLKVVAGAVSWFLRGRYWPRLRWPGTWYGGNSEHNPTGPAQADCTPRP